LLAIKLLLKVLALQLKIMEMKINQVLGIRDRGYEYDFGFAVNCIIWVNGAVII
jgi:hypothetical protein